MSDKLRKSYRLDPEVVERLQVLATFLKKENGINFTQTDVITYLTNWYYHNLLPEEEREKK